MRYTLVVALAAAGAAAVPASPAAAHDYHYRGHCATHVAYYTLNPGPGSTQSGVATASFVVGDGVYGSGRPNAETPTTPISVECHLMVNGQGSRLILAASGDGVAAGVAPVSFVAGPEDVVTICEVVTVGGEEHRGCPHGDPTPIPPQVVNDIVDAVLDLLP